MLTIQELCLAYNNSTNVLNKLSLHLPQGEIAALIGRSGAGKTSLFKALTGLLPIHKGSVQIHGSFQLDGNISYMMQEDLLLPWRTVMDNMLLYHELGKKNSYHNKLKQEALNYLNEVGLSDYAHYHPHQLSKGMRQRVSLARALLQKKPLMLLDEPFGALDAVSRDQMHDLLLDLQRKHKTTVLMITHDFRDALMLSDRIFLLAQGAIMHEWLVSEEHRNNPNEHHRLAHEMKAALKHF